MEPIDQQLHQLVCSINDSRPSTVPRIKQRVTVLLEQVIGSDNNRKKLRVDAKCNAGNLVKRLLTTIEKRLKRRPEVDLFETHAECISYLKHLCEVNNSQETKYEYLERQCGLMDCYEHMLRYEDVEREGYAVLNVIRKSMRKRKLVETAGQVLPTNTKDHPDPQTVKIVTTAGMALLRARWSSIKDSEENEDACRLFLSLVKEMEPWRV
ncbi:hypothetical protein Tco_1535718 [Tanacetum coccineum]